MLISRFLEATANRYEPITLMIIRGVFGIGFVLCLIATINFSVDWLLFAFLGLDSRRRLT